MQNKIDEILNSVKTKLSAISASSECQALRVEVLGKSGSLTGLFRFMKEVPAEEKGKVGAILNNAKVPAVMVECGFISNPEEAALLNTEEYQQKVAMTIFKGLTDYLNEQ